MPHREPADLLIETRWLMPMAINAAALPEQAVAIAAGRILATGPAAQLRERFAPREHVLRPRHVLLPGLVNAYTRAAHALLSAAGLHGPPARWLLQDPLIPEGAALSADFVRDGTRLAMAQMLKAGVTCFADLSLHPEEVAQAVAAAPMRASIALPVAEVATHWAEGVTGHLARAEQLWDTYRSDARISLYFSPLSVRTLSDATLTRVRRVADELEARIALPLRAFHEESLLRDGATRPAQPGVLLRHLDGLGLVRPGFAAFATEGAESADLELLERKGAALILSPRATLALGYARLPAAALPGAALGSDTPAAVGSLDVLEEARCAQLMGLEAGGALRLATHGGACALGLQAQIGSIEVGKLADLTCIDVGSLECRSQGLIAQALLFGATRSDVSDVWCGGRAAVSEHRLLAFDEEELASLPARWGQRLKLEAAA